MGIEDIPVGEQWETVRTAKELERLKQHVMEFMSHTAQTMMRPKVHMLGGYETDGDGDVLHTHPLSHTLQTIQEMTNGVLLRYGQDMYKQAVLFDEHFGGDL